VKRVKNWIWLFGWTIGAIALLAIAWVDPVKLWSNSPMTRVVYVGAWSAESDESFQQFRSVLNLRRPKPMARFDLRYVSVDLEQPAVMQSRMAQAIRDGASILVAPTVVQAQASLALDPHSPVVFASYAEPLNSGLVEAKSKQARAITGVSLADHLDGKRLEILQEAFPRIRRVAVLADKYWMQEYAEGLKKQAHDALKLDLNFLVADSLEALQEKFDSHEHAVVDAWFVPSTYISYIAEKKIIEHIGRQKKPAIFSTIAEVKSGAMMAYAQDNSFANAAMADLVHRILNGEDAASIPVERPRRIVLAVRADAQVGGQRINPVVVRKADLVF